MAKSADAFRTISEVAEWLDTPAHVLRFWESKFSQLKPVKRAGGRRYYRPSDMLLLGGIKKLLHSDGMTIKGVQKLLRKQGIKHVSGHSQPLDEASAAEAEVSTIEVIPKVVIPPIETEEDVRKDEPQESAPQATEDSSEIDTASDVTKLDDASDVTSEDSSAQIEHAVDLIVNDTASQRESTAPTDQETEDNIEDQASVEELPVLPSFLHRTSEPELPQEPEAPETAVEAEPEELASPTPKPKVVEVPDDPDDGIAAESGVITQIAAMRPPVSNEMADRLKQVLERLRQGGSGNGAPPSS